MKVRTVIGAICLSVLAMQCGCSVPNSGNGSTTRMTPERWEDVSAVRNRTTHMVPATWTLDKYPNAATLKPHSTLTLLDQQGPGVVTLFHASDYGQGDDSQLILRIWYDNETDPAIDMPLMDFLGDIQSATQPYSTIHFSHVRKSHNFRLPMPFRDRIRIEVENPTPDHLFGYMDIQWDQLAEVPSLCGYLRVAYQKGHFRFPHEELTLCNIKTPGTIVAHWLQLEGDHRACANGQGTCEGNHEVYLDGHAEPTVESLGIEDFYGHSWGFTGMSSDFYAGIVRLEETPKGGVFGSHGSCARYGQDHVQKIVQDSSDL